MPSGIPERGRDGHLGILILVRRKEERDTSIVITHSWSTYGGIINSKVYLFRLVVAVCTATVLNLPDGAWDYT